MNLPCSIIQNYMYRELRYMSEEEKYMKEAIRQAKKAYALREVPIGCVIVYD